jgi:Mn-dependent DtxR family transcriptional regulator
MRINQPHIKRFEVISEDGVVVKATGTKELALIINLSRVTISRMVSHLQEGDSIRYKNTTITRI